MAKILLIDDDADFRYLLKQALEERGHLVECLEGAAGDAAQLRHPSLDVVLLDNQLPGITGIEILETLQRCRTIAPVILMTNHASTDTAIRAMNLGAFDYVIKPLRIDELMAELTPLIQKALEIGRAPAHAVHIPGKEPERRAGIQLMGNSRSMQEVYKLVGRVAASPAPVLIRGETGCGKELIARAIHAHSPREDQPFVALNCAALNEQLLDDELFGHEPGAFTGAEKLRKGRFEYAHGGTLFLDEIGDMPTALQSKLLRVLETAEVSRMGSNESIRVDVRLVSATHRSLEEAVAAGSFREDLFYRLNGITIRVPPLRQRGDDVELLVRHFLEEAASAAGKPAPGISKAAWQKLREYHWPGNVRQLQNVVRRALLVCHGQVDATDLDFGSSPRAPAPPSSKVAEQSSEEEAIAGLRQAVRWALRTSQHDVYSRLHEMLEREALRLALEELKGNQTQVAKRLGLARNTVLSRIRTYGLD